METKLNLDIADFLANYWQKKPLLIRGAINKFTPPISADELAGLAMEEDVESRIIESQNTDWQLHQGPFSESDFNRENPWTLLVQSVDHLVPEVAALRHLLSFIPSWRIDDVMVSYATDGGSVGPHYDNYDVFLLQGQGRRRWQLGQYCDQDTPLIANPELRILQSFECSEEYVLESGDILYLPPRIAHWGVALDECTTVSLGFRAPRINDMISRQVDQLLDNLDSELFFTDPDAAIRTRAGEISDADIDRVREQISVAAAADNNTRWFGELVTEPRYELEPDQAELKQGRALLLTGVGLIRLLPSAKLAWRQYDDIIEVYANGITIDCTVEALDTLITLCSDWQLQDTQLASAMASPASSKLLELLHEQGCLTIQ